MPGAFQSPGGVAQLNAMASQQAEMMAYIEVFALLGIVSIACMPLILLMKSSPLVPVRPAEAEALIE
jgi:hypothetical protein